MSAKGMSAVVEINSEFTDKRQRQTKLFHDVLPVVLRLTDPMRIFQVEAFYKLVDVAMDHLEWYFEG